MKHLKQLALVLALSTSACAVQAAPQQHMVRKNQSAMFNKAVTVGAAAFLAYMSGRAVMDCEFELVLLLYKIYIKVLNNCGLDPSRRERYIDRSIYFLHGNKQPIALGASALTAIITFKAYHAILNRLVKHHAQRSA